MRRFLRGCARTVEARKLVAIVWGECVGREVLPSENES